ncbi:MAG TPA: EAL domain-containing protein [Steroidobacteraceae bacterium]|nr:EAL domain-containing protein [Steroidobacteraceae bacterium]
MSSVLQRAAAQANGAMPFASFAQIVRMLVPPAHRVSFYDAKGRALWINDGVEEPDFRLHLEIILARAIRVSNDESDSSSYSAEDQDEPVFIFPIRDRKRDVLGAIGLVCRNLPASSKYRTETVEKLLAPVLEILAHTWDPPASSALAIPSPKSVQEPASAPKVDAAPLPAMLRRALALTTQSLDAAFGAIILPNKPFTLSHRASPDESDFAITTAIDNVRAQIVRWMSAKNDPLIVNTAAQSQAHFGGYKFLGVPLRDASGQLAAIVMLYRVRKQPDFSVNDVAIVDEIARQLPPKALTELLAAKAPPPPKPVANVVKVTAPVPTTKVARPREAAPASPEISKAPTASAVMVPAVTAGPVSMDVRVREALRNGAFDLYVQSIEPLRDSERPARFEVLLRLPDADQVRTPRSFMGAARSGYLMPDVDRWVVSELLKKLKQHALSVRTSCWEFCVNIAAQSLAADHFSDFLVAEVCKSAIPAGLLVFEVNEKDATDHEKALHTLAAKLRDVGSRIALDNCRAGLGTLASVRKWPVSCVKIDGSLIRNISTSAQYQSQVRALVDLATSMGVDTVAECVENQSVCSTLLDIGVDYAQGFHLGKPQPLSQLFK